MNILDKMSEYKRRLYLRYITDNIGFVRETNDAIICYVKEDKIDNGILMDLSKRSKKVNLDKKIYYVFDNIVTYKRLNILSQDNSEIIIKDCDFKTGLQIVCAGKCIIDNSFFKLYGIGYNRYNIISNELELKNIKENMIRFDSGYQLGIYVKEKLTLKNSNLSANNRSILLISDNILNIDNSSIYSSLITINAPKICTKGKAEINSDSIKMFTEDFDSINIITRYLEINGEFIDTSNKNVTLRKPVNDVEKKRLELIGCLKKIKTKVNEENQNRLNDYQKELENKPVKTLLKK